MFSGLEQYQQGHFFFEKGDNLRAVSKSVPNLPGVYYVLRLANGKVANNALNQFNTTRINKTIAPNRNNPTAENTAYAQIIFNLL